MADYHCRSATLADIEALIAHRIGMFTDMGVPVAAGALADAFRDWLAGALPSGTYLAWVVENDSREIVSGGGITIAAWPPGPRDLDGRMAFVYNVYTEPAHRRRGLARMVMNTIHAWCRENGIHQVALNASDAGRPLYESLGYAVVPQPMLIASLDS